MSFRTAEFHPYREEQRIIKNPLTTGNLGRARNPEKNLHRRISDSNLCCSFIVMEKGEKKGREKRGIEKVIPRERRFSEMSPRRRRNPPLKLEPAEKPEPTTKHEYVTRRK